MVTNIGISPAEASGHFVGQHVYVLDRVRIEVALEARSRYKYVQPKVQREGMGWKVVSPNCSRNVAADGAEIDIAWLVPTRSAEAGMPGVWLLHARDHRADCWVLKLTAPSLPEALERLMADPQREFWQ